MLPACARFGQKTRTELVARTKQERKPVKTNFKSQKENCQNLKGACLSPKSLCLARLPCCSAGRTRMSLSPSCCLDCHGQGKGSLAKAANCAVFSPHVLRPPPGCTLQRDAPQADTDSPMSFAVKEPQVCLSLSLSSHAGLSLSLTRNFLKKLLSPSRKPPHRADSGLAPHTSVASQAMKPFVPSLSHPKFQEPDCTSHTWISFPLRRHSTTVTYPSMECH